MRYQLGEHAVVCCDRCLGDHGALQEVSALVLRSGVEVRASAPSGTIAASAHDLCVQRIALVQ